MWWAYYLFSVAASGVWLNWTVAGTALLTLLFQMSTTMTEVITARKYPAYKEYQRTTSRLLPWFPGMPAAAATETAPAAAPSTAAEKTTMSPPSSPIVVAARSPAAPPSSARSPRTRAQRARRTQHD